MYSISKGKVLIVGTAIVAAVATGLMVGSSGTWAAAASSADDITAPTTPTNLRQTGVYRGQVALGWNPSSDDSGKINHYSVLVGGSQVYRPRDPAVRVFDLVQFCHLLPGHAYTVTVEAVDSSGNRSGPSAPLQVTVS